MTTDLSQTVLLKTGEVLKMADLSAGQLDGRACVRCGSILGPMVPVGYGPDSVQLFAHDKEQQCRI